MKVLILGANGMLGHKIYQTLTPIFDVTGTIRGNYSDQIRFGLFDESTIISKIDVMDESCLESVITKTDPKVVINCVGIVKQIKEANNKILSLEINSLLPHKLYRICYSKGVRLIHFSTDCVFSGKKGNYKESDFSDADDLYGRTKYLGEIDEIGALTIRTSIIGRELSTSYGLVEWLIANRNRRLNGYSNAIFTGFTTIRLANIIQDIIINHHDLEGLYQISSYPISKYKLLSLLNEKLCLNIDLQEYPDFRCDRSLDSSIFRSKTGFEPPTWEKMVDEFVEDAIQYHCWRN